MADLAEEKTGQTLSQKQLIALRAVDNIVNRINEEEPDLVERIIFLYRNDINQLQIARALIPDECEKSIGVARKAIGVILAKNLNKDELEELATRHIEKNAQHVGRKTAKEKRGIHAITKEERRILGLKSYPKSLGLLSKEQLGKRGRECGVEAMSHLLKKTGKKRISDRERSLLLELIQKPEFLWQEGMHKNKPNYPLIQGEIEKEFGIRRKTSALKSEVYRLRHQSDS